MHIYINIYSFWIYSWRPNQWTVFSCYCENGTTCVFLLLLRLLFVCFFSQCKNRFKHMFLSVFIVNHKNNCCGILITTDFLTYVWCHSVIVSEPGHLFCSSSTLRVSSQLQLYCNESFSSWATFMAYLQTTAPTVSHHFHLFERVWVCL